MERELEYTPFGELLIQARRKKAWSRKKLAQESGVSENSIVRYEKAGIDENEGHFPPAPKLAKLCFTLEIDPIRALIGCVPPKEHSGYKDNSYYAMTKYKHPQYDWIEKQLYQAVKDNLLLRNYVEHIIDFVNVDKIEDHQKWLLDEGREIITRYGDFEARMMQIGVFAVPFGTFYAPSELTEYEGYSWIFSLKNNGVLDENKSQCTMMRRSLNYYADRFKCLAEDYGKLVEK